MEGESHDTRQLPRTIGVVGGGTAGYFAALALKRRFPAVSVTIVESKSVPIIGVGEATTTLMPPFLHGQLGLDVVELFRAVKPTFKMGIKFEWGLPGEYYFTYPFGDADPIEAYAYERDLRGQSLVSMLMAADRVPVLRGPEGETLSLLRRLKFAYHLDNTPFVAFLADAARRAGIAHVEMTIARVSTLPGGRGVEALHGTDGRELRFDFFVDASGFRSLLIEHALGSPFESYASTLLCDRAIVATAPQSGPVQPYTTAETMDSGWCWRIPVEGEDHRGYVHASSFVSEDQAEAEMRAKNPGLGAAWTVRFRSGRHRDFWVGNTVALGNAYGFVEPLESTALHMVIIEIAYLLAGLEARTQPADSSAAPSFEAFASAAVGAHWDYLRWFLGVHYKFNRRLETPFWRAARDGVDVSGASAMIERFRASGPWLDSDGVHFDQGDPAFGFSGLMMLLLGQHVDHPVRAPATITAAQWEQRREQQRGLVQRALPQAEALRVLASDPRLLRDFAESKTSWVRGDAERAAVPPRSRQMVHPRGGMPSLPGADEALLRAVR